MQNYKDKFYTSTKEKIGTLQSCIRTNDIELVGDGHHLTYFEMLGNFSFGNNDYQQSIELWKSIISDLNIKVDSVHVHPQGNHHNLWDYPIVEDLECVWSDGDIGGYCCEIYSRGIEIGNLVNTLGHSVDVGFGFERLLMIVEGKNRVDETNLFDQELDYVGRDHVRTLTSFWENGIEPGNKGRNYICRKLIRRLIRLNISEKFIFDEWMQKESEMFRKMIERGKVLWRKHKDKSVQWWKETVGLTEEELMLLY